MLQIEVINEATGIGDSEIQRMLPGFTKQWNGDLQRIWGVEDATFQFLPAGQAPPVDSWWVVFLDNSDDPRALAYHDLTNDGFPLSKVFVKTILADNAKVPIQRTNQTREAT